MKKAVTIIQIVLILFCTCCKSTSTISKTEQNDKSASDEDQIFWDPYEEASFPGGTEALFCFLANNLNSKIVSNDTMCTGKVFVKFKIDTVGNISNVKIYKGYSSKVDTEITRVIRLMPNWNPYKVLHGKLKTGKWVKDTCSYIIPVKIPYKHQCP